MKAIQTDEAASSSLQTALSQRVDAIDAIATIAAIAAIDAIVAIDAIDAIDAIGIIDTIDNIIDAITTSINKSHLRASPSWPQQGPCSGSWGSSSH